MTFENTNDLFKCFKRKKLDKDSESFISLVSSIPADSVRYITEDTWISFGELQSRITIYCYDSPPLFYMCPAIIAYKILCIL